MAARQGELLVGCREGEIYECAVKINECRRVCHLLAKSRGWWMDLSNDASKERNVGEMLCLIHSEISEALEGYRKGGMDEHCPGFTSLETELADALIRILDMAGGLHLRIGAAFSAKLIYNLNRPDHDLVARQEKGGKKF